MDESTCVKMLEKHGIRPTSNRIVVLKALAAAMNPSSISDLENKIVTIDKSGIFRSLMLFREHRLVHVLEDGDGGVKYELCLSHDEDEDEDMHVHFYCEQCHRLFCLHDMPVPQVDLPEGYSMTTVNYVVKGTCPQCAERCRHEH
ncbi:hypothetical protein HMPREF0645_0458 [Hallella bergensis DSM 17361]|uniref:Transcriptional regulator, Fur family n=1 Tax=Hallella bergensis DSM 17361 TaxID=585502 RepID=D1PU23_9BACT|nr:transcriptional repressor [Hallella bergensis]EFA45125.1 hypothetical protein HMPREF0645_0458 [Hallella bergensis DSM 17361]